MEPSINAFSGPRTGPKKRVLFVVTQSELGGAQQFILQFLRHADKEMFEPAVAVGSDGDGAFTRAVAALKVPIYALSRLRRDLHPFDDLAAIGQLRQRIRELVPDTLFLCSSKAGFIGARAARGAGCKVIYRIGGWTFNDPWPAWKRDLWIRLERMSANWKDVIILNNAHDLAQAKELGIKPRQSFALIHNGLDPYKLEFLPREEARADLGLPPSKKVVGAIANFYPAKGLEYLVEAAARSSQEDCVWCVIGEGAERPKLERLIKERGLEHRVVLAGRKENAARYLHAFDVFVLPSVKEGFPWAILQAMAAKLPIVATRVGAVPEIIESGVNGYIVSPRDAGAIADHVALLLNSESQAREMGIQGHQRLLFAFNIDATVRQVEKLL